MCPATMSDRIARVPGVGDLVYLTFGPRRGLRKATSAVAHYELGCELETTDPGGAITAYRRALAGRPDLADAHNNLGRLLHDRGIALYWFNLGVVLEDLGRPEEAVATYEQALALDMQLADAHYNLARQIERSARATGDELMLRRALRHLKQYRELSRATTGS
jgi:tetratricopeptide (TPR) repeat protein